MNRGDHETTSTLWELIQPASEPQYWERRTISAVEGCPYDLSLTVKITEREILFDLDPKCEQLKFQRAGEADEVQLDRIFHVKKLVMSQPVHDWNLEDWIDAAPFLFTDTNGRPLEAKLLNDEEMQAERDTWT